MARRGRKPFEQGKKETKIALARERAGMTQDQAAEAAHMPLSTYWAYERGKVPNPSIRRVANIALAFGCNIEDLIENDWRRGTRSIMQLAAEADDPSEVFERFSNADEES